MRSSYLVLAVAVLLLSACESKLNPMNWFGNSTEERVSALPETGEMVDPRPLVDQISALAVERVPGGAIVRATGLPERQGYWEAALVPAPQDETPNATAVFQFRAIPPLEPTAQGTPQSREILAAVFLSDQSLQGVRTIVVQGARNRRSVRR